jgi:hypothetical protein
MRPFLTTVGVLAWIWALAVLWVFAEAGGALTVIAAGIFALVAVLALASERILKTLEEIRDERIVRSKVVTARDADTYEEGRGEIVQAPLA